MFRSLLRVSYYRSRQSVQYSSLPSKQGRKRNNSDIFKLLLNNGRVKVVLPTCNNRLLLAIAQGQVENVRSILSNAAVSDGSEEGYEQALRIAAENGSTEIVSLLLSDHRVDITADDNYALAIAVDNNHVEVVRLLVAHYTKLKQLTLKRGLENALGRAVRYGSLEMVELLLSYGIADLTVYDSFILRMAKKYERTDLEQLIVYCRR